MTTVPQIARRRSYKRHPGRRSLSVGTAMGCSLLVSLFLLLGGIAVSYFYVALTRDLPSLELFPLYLDPPDGMLLQPTLFYDRTGENILVSLENPAAADARYLFVNLSANGGPEYFSDNLIKATISNLEPDYWNTQEKPLGWLFNKQVNVIAQQLVSEIALWNEPKGLLTDLRVRLLASQVIDEYGREKILEWYLNSAKYGNLVYGADAAAHVYLGKSASDLNLEEGLLLTAIAEAPDINPHTVPDLVIERQQVLIQRLLDQGLMTQEGARSASNKIFNFREPIDLQDDFPLFTQFILDQLTSIIPRDRLERGGIRIITSMDFDLQKQTQCAMHGYLTQSGKLLNDLSAIDGSPCEAARLLPTVFAGVEDIPEKLNATAIITDPKNGQLLAFAMVSDSADNPAPATRFPAGTVLTPFIYLTAFTRGSSPGTMVWDIPEGADLSENDDLYSEFYKQINASEPYHGPMRLRTALANDYLRPAFMLMDQIGLENVRATLSKFGLFSQNSLNGQTELEQLLFEEEIGFIDIVRAYGILANQGVIAGQIVRNDHLISDLQAIEITGVLRLEDAFGNMLLDWSLPQSRSIVSPQLTYLVSHTLSDERARWASLGHPNPLEIGRPVAVKLSHTLDEEGFLVVGYDPEIVVGVWMKSLQDDEQFILPKLNTGLWHAIIQYALHDKPVISWQPPPAISMVEVCDPSGLLPTSNCPYVVTEAFLSGQEPSFFDTLYRSYQINRETGNLATVFTPPELIEERVYLVVPPQAEEWAYSEGFPLPPENYDTVGGSAIASKNVRIDSPEMFSHIGGMVSIRGSASGEGFSYYRIQVGQGLNPQEWIQIGKDFPEKVENDILIMWDTSGLGGLWVIRLLVVHQDQRVETAIQQVTIDNQAPELVIQYPRDGQRILAEENEILVLRADAIDDLEIAQVEIYLDDRLLSTLKLPPFVASWVPKIGEHTLMVKAQDMAGNVIQDSIEFSVDP